MTKTPTNRAMAANTSSTWPSRPPLGGRGPLLRVQLRRVLISESSGSRSRAFAASRCSEAPRSASRETRGTDPPQQQFLRGGVVEEHRGAAGARGVVGADDTDELPVQHGSVDGQPDGVAHLVTALVGGAGVHQHLVGPAGGASGGQGMAVVLAVGLGK
ncbi:hypothetical protein QBA75_40030 [Streptomyces stelliscabiei]